ncbi:MAG: hypothetical protein KAI47_12385, partial [Deltaproteobacteria bacterium]|nr:hypothetical protein [Deltaproteobacteria bacterium]
LRGPRRFSLRLSRDLRVGDVLQAARGRSFGLRLPGDAWVGVAGAVRLDRVPRRGEGRTQIRLTLISGRLRARATARGGCLAIGVGLRQVRFERGTLRLQRMAHGGLRVEILQGTYATVLGPPREGGGPRSRPRSVSPMTSLTFMRAHDVGAARALMGAPSGLRPARSRHERPPKISWDAVAGATTYAVEVALDADFLEVARTYHVTTTSVTPRGLSPGAYYWHVLASDGAHHGRGSKVYRFIVLASR